MLKLNKDINLWIWSDIHFNHKNLCKGVSSWGDNIEDPVEKEEYLSRECRDFDTLEEMNEAILESGKLINDEDVVIFCGDLLFGDKEAGWKILSDHFNFKNWIWILGNHDCDWIDKSAHAGKKEGFMFVGDYLQVSYRKQRMCCFHYPMKEWDKRAKGSWAITGHSHGNYPYTDGELGLDVGWDIFRKPLAFEEVHAIMGEKKPVNVGHHRSR